MKRILRHIFLYKNFFVYFILFLLILIFSPNIQANQPASGDDAITLVKKGTSHLKQVGKEMAFADLAIQKVTSSKVNYFFLRTE